MTLRQYLDRHNLTVADFARLMGASYGAVSKWTGGERHPRPTQIQEIERLTKGDVKAADFIRVYASRQID